MKERRMRDRWLAFLLMMAMVLTSQPIMALADTVVGIVDSGRKQETSGTVPAEDGQDGEEQQDDAEQQGDAEQQDDGVVRNLVTFEIAEGAKVSVEDREIADGGTAEAKDGTLIYTVEAEEGYVISGILVDGEIPGRHNTGLDENGDEVEIENEYIIEHIRTDETVVSIRTEKTETEADGRTGQTEAGTTDTVESGTQAEGESEPAGDTGETESEPESESETTAAETETEAGTEAESEPESEPETTAAETESESEVPMPEVALSQEVGDVVVTAKAAEGVLPEGATMTAEEVTANADRAEEIQTLGADVQAKGYEATGIRVFNIVFADADGNEIQPEGSVEITYKEIDVPENTEKAFVYHIGDDGSLTVLSEITLAAKPTAPLRNGPIAFVNDDGEAVPVNDTLAEDTSENTQSGNSPAGPDTESAESGTDGITQIPATKSDITFTADHFSDKAIVFVRSAVNTIAGTVDNTDTITSIEAKIANNTGVGGAVTEGEGFVLQGNTASYQVTITTKRINQEGITPAKDIYFEVYLPFTADQAAFNIEGLDDYNMIVESGTDLYGSPCQVLKGHHTPEGNVTEDSFTAVIPVNITVPKSGENGDVIDEKGLPSGTALGVSGKFWADGNTEEEIKKLGNSGSAEPNFPKITVTDHDAHVTRVDMQNPITGTEPFNKAAETGDGTDHAENDLTIRSFDSMWYKFRVYMDSFSGVSYDKGTLHMEVRMKSTKMQAIFDEDAMSYLDECKVTEEKDSNGDTWQVLCGEYNLTEVGGNFQDLNVAIRVLAMNNGETIKPIGCIWMENNQIDDKPCEEPNEDCTLHHVQEAVPIEFQEVTVTAKLKLNAQLKTVGLTNSSIEGDFDFDKGTQLNKSYGEVNGRIFGYGVTLMMYDRTYGLKGQQIPNGDEITLKIKFTTGYTTGEEVKSSKDPVEFSAKKLIERYSAPKYTDPSAEGYKKIVNAYQPLLYSVESNYETNTAGKAQQDGRFLQNTKGDVSDAVSAYQVAPHYKANNYYSCENGGEWRVVSPDSNDPTADQSGDTVTLKVSGYEIKNAILNAAAANRDNLTFPRTDYGCGNASTIYRQIDTPLENIERACFSAGEVWIIQPYNNKDIVNEEEELGRGTFTVTAEVQSDMTIGNESITDVYAGDNKTVIDQYILPPGHFRNYLWYSNLTYQNDGKETLSTGWSNTRNEYELGVGDDYAIVGEDNLGITFGYYYQPDGVDENRAIAGNAMVKFDGDALQITDESINLVAKKDRAGGIVRKLYNWEDSNPEATCNAFFGHFADNRNWNSLDEMQKAEENALIWDPASRVDLTGKTKYVAVLVERRGLLKQLALTRNLFRVSVKVRETATPGQVYPICETTRLWNYRSVNDDNVEEALGKIPSAATASGSGLSYTGYKFFSAKVYSPAKYNDDGLMTKTATGGNEAGDSLYIVSYNSSIEKIVAQQVDGQPKASYNFDRGERVADYQLTASFDIKGAEDTSSLQKTTTVTIYDTLPKGMALDGGDVYWCPADENGEVTAVYTQSPNAGERGTVTGDNVRIIDSDHMTSGSDPKTGETKLTFTIENVPIKGGVAGKLYYSVTLGDENDSTKDLKNNTSLVNTAQIHTTEDRRVFSKSVGNEDTATIKVFTNGSAAFGKTVEQKLNEVSDLLAWNLKWSNNSPTETQTVQMVDAMPVAGEEGSSFEGAYSISEWKLDPAKLHSNKGTAGSRFKVYYTLNSQYDNCVLKRNTSNDGVPWDEIENKWTKATVAEDGTISLASADKDKQVVAWAISGELEPGESTQIRVEVEQGSPAGGDVLVNKASTSEFVRTAAARRVQRKVSGRAWLDEDYDGCLDDSELLLSGITVILEKKNGNTWEQARDVSGSPIGDRTTATDGYYEFPDLPQGTYRIRFEGTVTLDGEPTDINSLVATKRYTDSSVSAPNAQSSKAISDTAGVRIDAIEMAAANKMALQIYHLQHQNAGFTRTTSIDVEKVWSQTEASPKVDYAKENVQPSEITVGLYKKGTPNNTLVRTIRLNAESDWKGTFDGLPYYENQTTIDYLDDYVVEETALSGYDKNITFAAKANGEGYESTVTNTLKWREAYNPLQLKIRKFREGTDPGWPVSGAVFELKNTKPSTTDAKTCTTGADGLATIDFVTEGVTEKQQYTLTEKTAPAGYTRSSTVWTVEVVPAARISWDRTTDTWVRTWSYTLNVNANPTDASDFTYSKDTVTLTVSDKYSAVGDGSIQGTKTVRGGSMLRNAFAFGIYTDVDCTKAATAADGIFGDATTNAVVPDTITDDQLNNSKAAGSFSFSFHYDQSALKNYDSAKNEVTGEAGPFYVKETTTAAEVPGYTPDPTTYVVTVSIKDDGAGHLTVTPTITGTVKKNADGNVVTDQDGNPVIDLYTGGNSLAFVNEYKAIGTVTIEGIKEVVQADWDELDDKTFTFELYEGGLPDEGGSLAGTNRTDHYRVSNNPDEFKGNNLFQFNLNFSMEDLKTENADGSVTYGTKDFTFVIKEQDKPGFTNEGSTYYEVTYTVSDNGNGKLAVERTGMFKHTVVDGQDKKGENLALEGSPAWADFTNIYLAEGKAEIGLSKTLSGNRGNGFAEGEFSFTAAQLTNDPREAAGEGEFTPEYAEGKSYDLEVLGSSGGAENGIYSTTASATIIYDQSVLEESKNPNTTKPPYGAVIWYELKENETGKASVTKSDAVYYVRVELHNDYEDQSLVPGQDGKQVHKMTSEVSYWKFGENGTLKKVTGDENVSFENHYEAEGQAVLEVYKTLTGNRAKAIQDDEFTFEARRITADPAGRPEGDAHADWQAEADSAEGSYNAGTGKVEFDPLNFDEFDIGHTYVYEITEKPGDDETITYSDEKYYAEVSISDGGSQQKEDGTEDTENVGKLKITVEYYYDSECLNPADAADVVFTNHYNADGDLTLDAEKLLIDSPLPEGLFSFELMQVSVEATKPAAGEDTGNPGGSGTDSSDEGDENPDGGGTNPSDGEETGPQLLQTKTNDADGRVVFDRLVYDEDDIGRTYTYTVSEVNNAVTGVTYDTTVYTVKVQIEDSADSDGTLAVTKTVARPAKENEEADEEGNVVVESMTFTNTFAGSVTLTKTSTRSTETNPETLAGAAFQLFYQTSTLQGDDVWMPYNNASYVTGIDGTLTVGGLPAGKYYFVETQAPTGYVLAADADGRPLQYPFTIGLEDREAQVFVNAALTVTNAPDAEDTTLVVTKQLVYENELWNAVDETFYVALFSDEELTERVTDLQPIVFQNSNTSSATFTDLEYDQTYYVGETNDEGVVLNTMGGVIPSGQTFSVDFNGSNATTVTRGDGTQVISFRNVFTEIPQEFYREGSLTVTKQLLGADGVSKPADGTFYAGIFADAEYTKLSEDVSQNIVKLTLGGASSVSDIVKVTVPDGGSTTVYVTEVDRSGKPVAGAASFRYDVTVDGAAVTMDEQNLTGTVVITNQEREDETYETEFSESGEEGEDSVMPASTNSVKTGDDTPIGLYVGLLLAAALLLIVVLMVRRRKRS